MGIQIRPKGSKGKFYDPERDILHLLPEVVGAALRETDDHTPAMRWFYSAGGTQDELIQAAKAIAQYFNHCKSTPGAEEDIIKLSGLADLTMSCKCVLGWLITRSLFAQFYWAARDNTGAEGYEPEFSRVIAASTAMARYFSWSKPRRWIFAKWWSLRGGLSALFGKRENYPVLDEEKNRD